MKKKSDKDVLNFIDVFSGAGGLSCGMEMAGLRCLLGVEIDKYAAKTFAHNHKHAKVFCDSIHKLTKKKLEELLEGQKIHAVVGGPPCQGFSTVGIGNPNDERNSLFREFVRLVEISSPEFVIVENVTGLLAEKNEKTLKAIFSCFERLGYSLDVQVMSAQQYGVPEKRRRTIIIGSKRSSKIVFPLPTHDIEVAGKRLPAVTVGEALRDLKTAEGKILNHDIAGSKIKCKIEEKRIACVPEGKGVRYEHDEENYFPASLKLGVDWANLKENRFRQTKFQRLSRKAPSPTIMTHRHSYYHPVENRYLTQREAAKIQSFPNDFEFHGPLSAQWRQIGNAVPPLLGKALGTALLGMWKEIHKPQKNMLKEKREMKNRIETIRSRAFVYEKAA